ncbi:MAG TPA: hypothetical protein VNG13_15080 [Mycobacteriales bacterium]|nr:hypothetical protein [Mycobacteriales bacterium]
MTVSVRLPEELAARLATEASRRGLSVDELTTQLLADWLPTDTVGGPRRLSFAGVGSSAPGGGDLARRHKQLRAEAFADKTARDV